MSKHVTFANICKTNDVCTNNDNSTWKNENAVYDDVSRKSEQFETCESRSCH